MTDTTPEDWVLIEAAKKCGIHGGQLSGLRSRYAANSDPFRALCDMIAKHEQPPVDRKLLCAREAALEQSSWSNPEKTRQGHYDHHPHVLLSIRAIELWEEGFGK